MNDGGGCKRRIKRKRRKLHRERSWKSFGHALDLRTAKILMSPYKI